MNADHESLKKILAEAAAIANPSERKAYLASICRGNPRLHAQVEGLLSAKQQTTDFLEEQTIAMEGQTTVNMLPLTEKAGDRIDRYKLLQQIGEGGMGVVYMAEQTEPMVRKVALKIIKLGMDTKHVVARFEAERQVLALMDHPNIAKVLDAGATDTGRPYFVMELVRGVPITEYCDKNHLNARERLQLFIPVCQAIQHAHHKGIIHRDIKPSNVLVTLHDGRPIPMVIDFGIAKATNQKLTEKTLFTNFALMIGTPAYMSPEQAEMSKLDVDTRSDVYSLGVLLYELLTGTTPLTEKRLRNVGYGEMQRIIAEEEPERPSTRLSTMEAVQRTAVARNRAVNPMSLNSLFRGDLDWIVMKCLEKDRTRRYETATGLADDIHRYLNDEPVSVVAPTPLYQLKKFIRRHRALVGATTALLIILVLATVISLWQWARANKARQAETVQRVIAQAERDKAEGLRAEAERARQTERQERQRAESSELNARRNQYSAMMLLARTDWEENNLGRLRKTLAETGQHSERGFEWFYWQRMRHMDHLTIRAHSGTAQTPLGPSKSVSSVAFSPNGERLASAGLDGTAKVWDVESGRQLFNLEGHVSVISSIAFSPNGKTILTASKDQTLRLWNADTGKNHLVFQGHFGPQFAVFSPDGLLIASCGWDHTVRLWEAATGKELRSMKSHLGPVYHVAFSRDGTRLASASADTTARIWEVASGRQVLSLVGHRGPVDAVAFSPDGRAIATGSDDGTIRIWDAGTGRELLKMYREERYLFGLVFSPDGKRIASGGEDRTIKIWDAATGIKLSTIRGHEDWVTALDFSSDGTLLASGSADGTIKIWDPRTIAECRILEGHGERVQAVAYSPGGDLIASASADATIKLWDPKTGRGIRTLEGHGASVNTIIFSGDGKRLISGSSDGTIKIWDSSVGTELITLNGHLRKVNSVALFPDGRRLVSGGDDRVVRIWDTGNGEQLHSFGGHTDSVLSVAISPQSDRVVSGSRDGKIKMWDMKTGRQLMALEGPQSFVTFLIFSPDGKRIIAANEDRTIKFIDASTGREVQLLEGHGNSINCIALSPDGQRLASAAGDNTVKLWEYSSGRELLTFKEFGDRVQAVAFSPDGQIIITGGDDRKVRIWEAASKERIALWSQHERDDEARIASYEVEKARHREHLRVEYAHDPLFRDWLVLAPIPFRPGESMTDALLREQIPGEAQLSPRPGNTDDLNGFKLDWRQIHLTTNNVIDFLSLLEGPATNCVGYAVCYLYSEAKLTDLLLKIGSDDQSRLYLNGKLVYQTLYERFLSVDRDIVAGLELQAGLNVLVLKVVNGPGEWESSLRLTDKDGHPLKGVKVLYDPTKAIQPEHQISDRPTN